MGSPLPTTLDGLWVLAMGSSKREKKKEEEKKEEKKGDKEEM